MILPSRGSETAGRIAVDSLRACSCSLVLQRLGAGFLLLLVGCDGPQSTLTPAGEGASRVATLFWVMATGAAIIWIVVVGLGIYALRVQPAPQNRRAATLIIGGGAVLPTIVLTALLIYGLAMLPRLVAPAPEGSLVVTVTGEQWWWRVRYEPPEGEPFELANEIRLPVGQPVQFRLESADVIHSFWIPSLGGKVDMIPGRVNQLALHPERVGVYRGACAEYCGTSHALMNFWVVVEEEEDFARWLHQQTQQAEAAVEPPAVRGRELFLSTGCGACHTIRGTAARGVVGPDLTHVGGRLSLGAGILPNGPDDFMNWIAATKAIKPEVHMPAFDMLSDEDLRALAAYLDELE